MWGYGSHSTPSSNSTGFEETSLKLPSSNSWGLAAGSSFQLTCVRASCWSLEASALLLQWQIGSFKYSLKQHCLFSCKKATTEGIHGCFEVLVKLTAVLPSSTCKSNHVCWIHCMVNGIWNKATKVFEVLEISNLQKKRMNERWLLIYNHECIYKFTNGFIFKSYFERCQIGCIDRLWNTYHIHVRDVPFERKCKCPLKGATVNVFFKFTNTVI